MFTKYENGAEVEVTEVYRYADGAEQEAEAVYAYKDGAEVEVWSRAEYIIKDGVLVNGYTTATDTTQNSNTSDDDCDPEITEIYGYGEDYALVMLSVNLPSTGTNSGYGTVIFSPAIDPAEHTTVWFETTFEEMEPYSGNQDISSSQTLDLTDRNSTNYYGSVLRYAMYYGKSENGNNLYRMDLSGISITGYLHFTINFDYGGCTYSGGRTHNTKIYNMWLE